MAGFLAGLTALGPIITMAGPAVGAAITGDLEKGVLEGVSKFVSDNPQVQQLVGAASQVRQMSSGFTSGFVQGLGGKVEGTVRGYVDQQLTSKLGDLQGAAAAATAGIGAAAAATDETIAALQGNATQRTQNNSTNTNNAMNLEGGAFDLTAIMSKAATTIASNPAIQQLKGSVGQIGELTSVVKPGFVQEKMDIAKTAVQGFADQQIMSRLEQVQAASDAAAARLSTPTAETIAALEANALQDNAAFAVNNAGNPIRNDFNMEGGGELVLGPSKVPPSVANKSGPSPLPPHMKGGSRKKRVRRESQSTRKRQRRKH